MDPPTVCPDCGARDAYERRYTTGGGWRVEYRCGNCGRRHTPKNE
jgi:DNA-directed RNA polymerase subunit RPC12/RpoP